MVFSSEIFLFYFLPFALLVYYLSPRMVKALSLTLLSYLFYGWWNPWFVLLMLSSTLVDYGCGKMITSPGASPLQRKTGLVLSVVVNLVALGFFKYAAFFAYNLEVLGLGVTVPDFLYRVVLPVGISFYTFQSMSYSIDLYRGHALPASNFIDFACYVSMFPQLVAGPIVRYGSVAEQLRSRVHSLEGFVVGFTRFNYGFAKKILIANQTGPVADACFAAGEGSLSAGLAWLGILAYAFQIYFDFSAYSDMAIGLGRMFGFRFAENFDSPYRAQSITDFWRRWHISLSSFLRDYLYIPLGGNRKGIPRTYINLLVVMLIGGLWHGAQWTFVFWGLIHGFLLMVERFFGWGTKSSGFWVFPRIAITFVLLLITWVFFRAENLETAFRYLTVMLGFGHPGTTSELLARTVLDPLAVGSLILAACVTWILPRKVSFFEEITWWKCLLSLILLWMAVRQMAYQEFNPFLYFQF